jgi:hypothetical protein
MSGHKLLVPHLGATVTGVFDVIGLIAASCFT